MPEKTKESIPEGPGRAVRLRVPRQEKVGAGRPASAMQVRLVSSPSINSRTPFLIKQILIHDKSKKWQLKDIWQSQILQTMNRLLPINQLKDTIFSKTKDMSCQRILHSLE